MKKARGFTLLELMVVVAIIAILASLAFNSYTKQLRKSRRAEAKQLMADYALREEKWRNNNATYGTLANINGATPTPSGNYSLTVTYPSSGTCAGGASKGQANSFIITGAAVSGQPQAADTGCTTMTLTNDCGDVVKAPASCW